MSVWFAVGDGGLQNVDDSHDVRFSELRVLRFLEDVEGVLDCVSQVFVGCAWHGCSLLSRGRPAGALCWFRRYDREFLLEIGVRLRWDVTEDMWGMLVDRSRSMSCLIC